jgi:hypothetical protein
VEQLGEDGEHAVIGDMAGDHGATRRERHGVVVSGAPVVDDR